VTFHSRYIRALIFENLCQVWQFVATPLQAPSESHSWPHMRDRVVPLMSCTDSRVGRERESERESESERERRERRERESSFRFSCWFSFRCIYWFHVYGLAGVCRNYYLHRKLLFT